MEMYKNRFKDDAIKHRRAETVKQIIGGIILAAITLVCVVALAQAVGSPEEREAIFIARLDQG